MFPASGFILPQVDLTRRFCIYTVGGSAREAPGPIATLSGTLLREAARGHLCRTIDWLPSILSRQLSMMCSRPTAGWTVAGYGGLPSPETLLEEIWRWYLPRASPPKRCPPRPFLLERLHCRPSLI